jgi:sigma-B regulation protein RsbU (phosphoserine phosphatase)
MDTPTTRLIAEIRGEIPAAAIGFMLLGLGLAVGAVALVRRRKSDLALFYFSSLCILYSVRLLIDIDVVQTLYSFPLRGWQKLIDVLTYVIPVPAFLFFEQVLGSGRWSVSRRLWQANAAFALVAIPLEIVSSSPGVLLGPYRLLVIVSLVLSVGNLFAPGRERTPDLRLLRASVLVLAAFALYENLRGFGLLSGPQNVEPVGFLLFVAGLGTIAARRVFEDQERLSAIRQELETARRIQESTLPGEPPRLPGLDLAARYVPASEVAGDFYDFLPGEGRRIGLIVADVSGHGVPAALVAAMLKVATASQAAHAASPARVLSEINQIFHGKLKNQFITALCVHLDLEAATLRWASAGHPPPLLWKAREGRVEELAHGGIVIGRLRRAVYTEASAVLEPGDRLLLFTDGIPEAVSPTGEQLGDDRLRAILAEHATAPAGTIADALLARVAAWTGRNAAFDDDLTLVVAGIEAA